MNEQANERQEPKKPYVRYDPMRPVYELPVHFHWGELAMEKFRTEEERLPIAERALFEAANSGKGFKVEFHFFDYEGNTFLMNSGGYPEMLSIFCDLDICVPPPEQGETVDDKIEQVKDAVR